LMELLHQKLGQYLISAKRYTLTLDFKGLERISTYFCDI